METFRTLLRKYHSINLSYMLEGHLNFILRSAISSYDLAYLKAAAKLLKDCIRLDVLVTQLDFIDALLDLCEDPALIPMGNELNKNGVPEPSGRQCNPIRFMGFTILTALLKMLPRRSYYLDNRLLRILSIIFVVLASNGSQVKVHERNLDNELTRSAQAFEIMDNAAFIPTTLDELGWKAWQTLCGAADPPLLQKIVLLLCEKMLEGKWSFCTSFSFDLFFILTASAKSNGTTAFMRMPDTFLTFLQAHFTGQQVVFHRMEEKAAASRCVVRDGSEHMLRDRLLRLRDVDDGLHFLSLWLMQSSSSEEIVTIESLLNAVEKLLEIVAEVIKSVPGVVHYGVLVEDLLSRLPADPCLSRVYALPMPIPLYLDDKREEKAASDLLVLLGQLVSRLGKRVARIGAGLQIVCDALLSMQTSIAQQRFVGTIEENILLQHFRCCGAFFMQVLMATLRVDYRALTICPPRIPVILTESTMRGLLDLAGATYNAELSRQAILVIMTLLTRSEPLCEYFVLHNPASGANLGLFAQDIWRRNHLFYPQSTSIVHGLLSFQWDRLLALASQTTARRQLIATEICLLWNLMAQLLFCHGPQAAVGAIPMLLSLEQLWRTNSSLSPFGVGILQIFVLGSLLTMADAWKSTELLAFVQGHYHEWSACPSAEAYTLVTMDFILKELRVSDVASAIIDDSTSEKNITASVELRRENLLQILVNCRACQSLLSAVHKAFDVSFLPHHPETLNIAHADSEIYEKQLSTSILHEEGSAEHEQPISRALFTDDGEEDGTATTPTNSRQSASPRRRGSHTNSRGSAGSSSRRQISRSRSRSHSFNDDSRYSKTALRTGFSVAQNNISLLGLDGDKENSKHNDSTRRCAVSKNVRTEQWRVDFRASLAQLEEVLQLA
eukprot:scaffold988_cov165-Ochromonas_danica.AAC.64